MYDVLIYDFDGTLADQFPIMFKFFLETAASYGWTVNEEIAKRVRCMWGASIGAIVEACWPGKDPKALRQAVNDYNTVAFMPLFPGAKDALWEMAERHPQMICTSRLRNGLLWLLTEHGISDCFTRLVTRSIVRKSKPDPESLDRAIVPLEGIGWERRRVLYVGDAMVDYECALAAEVDFVLVAESENVEPQRFSERGLPDRFVIDSVSSLPKRLRQL